MSELNYKPNALARSLRLGQTHTLGLILPDSANPFFAEIGHAIEAAAFERGYSVILCNTENDQTKELLYTEVLENKQVDGMIFVATGGNQDALSSIVHKGLPLVVVDREMGGLGLDTVTTTNYQGGLIATQHLIDLGHKIIGCVTGPSDITPSAERVNGYCDALDNARLNSPENMIVRGDFHAPSGFAAATQLFQQQPRPTALFVCNDMMAIGALQAAAKLGLRVPDDAAIIGFDNIELATYTIREALSAIYRTGQRFGAVYVIDVLRGKETERVQRLDHEHLGVFGVGAELDEQAWRDVFSQLVALGLVHVDHAAFGALRLTPASRAVLKGEQPVEMRRAVKRERRPKRARPAAEAPSAAAVASGGRDRLEHDAGSADPAGDAGRYARLRAWRLAEARRQALPAYVILHDATLAEIARRRPRDLAALGEVPGIGARKLERYGTALLELMSEP